MIIQICGHLIDTQYIYKVSNITTEYHHIDDKGFRLSGQFEICFLNQKSIVICKSGNAYKFHQKLHDPIRDQERNEIKQALNNVRDQLICKWKTDQIEIPKIDF